MTETWPSADSIAEQLGLTKDTVYAWISRNGVLAHKLSPLWKFQVSDVATWVRNNDAAETGT